MADLTGKIVLVTGAAGAIGAAVTAAVKRAGGLAIATDLGLAASASTRRSTSPRKPTGSASQPRSSASMAGSTGW